MVALYARAWVEMPTAYFMARQNYSRPLREGVGRNLREHTLFSVNKVALYARAWVEIIPAICKC